MLFKSVIVRGFVVRGVVLINAAAVSLCMFYYAILLWGNVINERLNLSGKIQNV